MESATTPFDLPGVSVFERGWLSSNNTLLFDTGDADAPAVLVDAGHVLHAPQTVTLLRHALGRRRLRSIVNTHLHSDHCGGNASVQRAFDCRLVVPPGSFDAVQRWDEQALSYAPTGQRCERFSADAVLAPGAVLAIGSQRWQAHAAPGHDPHSLLLFEPALGLVITADALWQRGFGVVFPELDGAQAFDEVQATLDLIESFDARWAVPGHGAPFADVAAALARARQRLAGFRADPQRHAHHAMKALIKFHLLEERQQAWPALLAWFAGASLFAQVWQRMGRPDGSLDAYARRTVAELVAQGVLRQAEGWVLDA